MGPQPAPLLPRWDLYTIENSFRTIAVEDVPCNWLQCMENSADPVHTEWLHGALMSYVLERQGKDPLVGREGNNFLLHHGQIGFERHPYGMVKRRWRAGQPEDAPDWKYGHLLVFPDKVRLAGRDLSESYQIRVPIDDEHTYHLCYNVTMAPQGVVYPKQETIPVLRSPWAGENGEPRLDYTLGQDMVGWYSQGAIVDRSEEKLGYSDNGVILFRRMLKEQMKIVEEGGEPMNVFRDPVENEYLETALHVVHSRRVPRSKVTLGGNMGAEYAEVKDIENQLEAILAPLRQ
jgi:5,5'-dehydrodivanillate O-demethylase